MNVSYISHISGKVQGVYFRVSSQQKAIEYGLSGYARNLADGEVEVNYETVEIDNSRHTASAGIDFVKT